jgi:hypothetical protein
MAVDMRPGHKPSVVIEPTKSQFYFRVFVTAIELQFVNDLAEKTGKTTEDLVRECFADGLRERMVLSGPPPVPEPPGEAKRIPCDICGEWMVGWEDMGKESEGWVWCPKCAPHDNIPRSFTEFMGTDFDE